MLTAGVLIYQRPHFIGTGWSLATFKFWIADSNALEEGSCLVETRTVRATLIIVIGELNGIVFPPADFAQPKSSRRFLVQRVVSTTWTWKALLVHSSNFLLLG